jgi:choline dehydrogenase
MAIWAELVNDSSYRFENVLPFFQKTVSFAPPVGTRFANATPLYNITAFDKDGQPLQVSYPKYATPFATWAKQGFNELGIEEVQDFNSGSLIGHQFCAMTIQQSDASRSSSESAFLRTGWRSGSWILYQFAMAKKILFDHQNRATGVVVQQGNQFVLTAKREVIISAGAFQSPQLLMVSGIGPAQVLNTHGVNLTVDLPGVGQNMWDHVFFGPSYQVDLPTLGMLDSHIFSLLKQGLAWLFGGNGLLTNPSADYIAFEKLPQTSRSAFSELNEKDLAWFPSDWPEAEVKSEIYSNFLPMTEANQKVHLVPRRVCIYRKLLEPVCTTTSDWAIRQHCRSFGSSDFTRECDYWFS